MAQVEQAVRPKLEMDVKEYGLRADDFHFASEFLYDRLGASTALRRTLVSLLIGLVWYAVGLVAALAIGFGGTYVTSPAVYLILLPSILALDRLRWGKFEIVRHLTSTRAVLLPSDAEYRQRTKALMDRLTAKTPVLVGFVLVFALTSAALTARVFGANAPTSLSMLQVPLAESAWFLGANLLVKLLIMEWLLAIVMFNFVSVVYAAAIFIPGWSRLALSWPVIPIPSAIVTKLDPIASFYLRGLAYLSITVFAVVLLFRGATSLPLILVVSILGIAGIGCALVPIYTIDKLAQRAKSEVADTVSRRYVARLYPVGANAESEFVASDVPDAYEELKQLEELMRETNESSGSLLRLNVLIPAVLSQALPFLGFLYPVIFGR